MIFNKSGKKLARKFVYNDVTLEIVKTYIYLGIQISTTGSFDGAIKLLGDKANKALARLKRIFILKDTNLKFYLSLFDKVIVPILLYASEIWGAYTVIPSKSSAQDNISGYCKTYFETFYMRFLKYCLGVHRKASNIAVYGELGKTPLSLKVMTRVCKNWLRIMNMDQNSLLFNAYKCHVEMSETNQSSWLKSVKDTLHAVGLQELWNDHEMYYGDFPSYIFKKQITEKFQNQWQQEIMRQTDDSKLRTYKLFKNDLKFERYLEVIKNFDIRKNITRLRISAHNLYIETGRHRRPAKVPVNQRLCSLCQNIEDEYHFVISCKQHNIPRQYFLEKIHNVFVDTASFSDQNLFTFIMKLEDTELISMFEIFMRDCIAIRQKSL